MNTEYWEAAQSRHYISITDMMPPVNYITFR